MAEDQNPEYWEQYNNLQRVKHELIRRYLGGFLPKLGSWGGKILYFDTHAGRGGHASGEPGSPIIALKAFQEHPARETVFPNCEIRFYFIEQDEKNCEELQQQINSLGTLPEKVKYQIINADSTMVVQEMLDYLRENKTSPAPSFMFVDPYGFKIPWRILKEFMGYSRVEMFANIIWRELDMAMNNPTMHATVDEILDGKEWRDFLTLEVEERAIACVNLLRRKTGARWATHIHMLGDNYKTRYILMHFTNHPEGRKLMKDCMWKVCPDAYKNFYGRVTDDPNDRFTFTQEPDLTPLHNFVISNLKQSPHRWSELSDKLLETMWLDTHLRTVISDLRKKKVLDGRDFEGKFSAKRNPELFLLEEKP